jgi:hypothetical protein
MINLLVRREVYTDESTIGEFCLNFEWFAWSLEPTKSRMKQSPYCIPSGQYRVVLQPSKRYGFTTPHILDVPNFPTVEIRPGNYPDDTECDILVGAEKGTDFIGTSKATFDNLMRQISDVSIGEPMVPSDPDGIQITILG